MPVNRIASAAVVAVLAAGTLVGCSSDAVASCPSGAPGTSDAPDWTYRGQPGSIEVVGPTDSSAPKITVQQPFSVAQTHVQRFNPEGDGTEVAPNATVTVCYVGVNGRTGKSFDSSFDRGTPAKFSVAPGSVIDGFRQAIVGQKVGSTVGVAIAPADGYPSGQPSAQILPGDTLIFVVKILSAE